MDIDVYVDFVYHGFFTLDNVEERFSEQQKAAEAIADELAEDEVLIYAIYTYDDESERVLSVNFVSLLMSYDEYISYYRSDPSYRRFFFVKGNKHD